MDFNVAMIPLVVLFVSRAVLKLAPDMPKGWIPLLAPFLGILLDTLAYYLNYATVGWQMAAILGMAGVGLHEIIDQTVKGNMLPKSVRERQDGSTS